MNVLIVNCLLFVIVPLWLLAGVCDWYCHRRTSIENNAGLRESALHVLMLLEVGIPVLFALFFEINAAFFALAIAALLAHELTALWDVSYAQRRRYLSPIEQHLHSFLEMLPLIALILIGILHWDRCLALFGIGDELVDFNVGWKKSPLPGAYQASIIVAIIVLQVFPYGEELWRCYRHRVHT